MSAGWKRAGSFPRSGIQALAGETHGGDPHTARQCFGR